MVKKIILGLMLSAIVFAGCSRSGQISKETFSKEDGIFLYNVGEFKVYMLVEGTREGSASILVDTNEELLSRYIPEEGFFQSTNAFLVKSPNHTVLIDTGTGVNGIVFDKIKKTGVDPEQIESVLITHLHGDHFGGLRRDGEPVFPKANIYLSALELEYFTEIQINQNAVDTLALYDGKVKTFDPADIDAVLSEILPGIKPIAAYGHTPGHTVFLIEDGDDKLLIVGDILHIGLVQFAVPEISAVYDVDKEAAAVSRRIVLDYAARNNIPFGGMHIAYPGIGIVETDEDGFKFIPIE